MSDLIGSKTDSKLFFGLIVILGFSMLFPEYIAPLFVFALYIYFIVHFKKTERNAKLGDMGKVIFAYTVYMLVSALWSDSHLSSVLIALLWMGCFLTYVLVANTVNTKDKLKMAITAINISSGVIGLIAIIEIITYNLSLKYGFHMVVPNPLYYQINDRVFDLLPVEIINKPYESRASATFDNPLILATYLVMTIPFCAYGSVYFKHSASRKISRVCLVFAIGGVICTFSRGAYIAVALSVVMMLISNKRIFKKLYPFVFVLAVAIPIALSLRYRTSNVDFLSSNNNRLDIWKYSIRMFIHNPIYGLGAGTDNIHRILRDTYGLDRSHTHNLFLQVIVEGGVIGLVFLILIIKSIINKLVLLYTLKEQKYRPYAVLYTASFIAFITISMFEFTLQSAKEMMIFFIILGLIEATARMETDQLQLADDDLFTYEEVDDEDFEEDEKKGILKQKTKV